MYRIESIVTSIILSYVDRYIKNFRRQDAQVSLWQGDGVFHNLDLDLEVLEQELNLPFSFVSGHINELLIHVPWTRIPSEPVQITINTIECVMKLCPPGGRPAPPAERLKRQQSQPPDEQTPQSQSYRPGLVNKLISNLSITCNNFILKYVEEDIVLSMNIKNLSLCSVNEKWEPEITELSAASLILRKLISLSDVTICLDKRNASGRIESYMEPLLYRCFLTIRLSRLYASPTATRAISTRMDVFCEKMAFTLSESQVPMLMRMFTLALALHRKQLTPQASQANMTDNNSETSAEDLGGDNNGTDNSWSTWMWSFVPSILPLSDDENADELNQSHTFNFGFYIDNFTLALKFCNVLIDLRGCLMELESHDTNWTNVQAGVSQITIEPSGDCCCGTSEQNQVPYLTAGSHQDSFLSGSLFGNTGTKVSERSWDYHLATVTETSLLEKTPAFAMDYLFSVEKQISLEEDDEDYEETSRHPLERVLLRFVADHIVIRVCSGVIHRTQMIMKAASSYDYLPYSSQYASHVTPSENIADSEQTNKDDIKMFIPQHITRFTLFHPTFEIYPANHSPVQPSALGRKLSRSKIRSNITPVALPTVCLVLQWDCLDAKLTRPLTPDKVKLLSSLRPTEIPTEVLNDSDARFSFKAVGISSFIKMAWSDTADTIKVIELNKLSIDKAVHNLACRAKSDVCTQIQVHIENFLLTISKPKLMLATEIINSLIMSNNRSRYQVSYYALFNTSLVQDAAIVSDIVYLKLAVDKLSVKQVQTGMSESIQVCVNSCQGFAVQLTEKGSHKQTMILDAPNTNTSTPLLTGIFQRPSEESQHAPVIMLSVHGVRLSVDPLIYSWLLYMPIPSVSAKTFHPQFTTQTSVLTTTGSSSKSRRVSDGSLGSMMKRAPTPQESIHSSETRSAQLSSQYQVSECIIETNQPTFSERITSLFPIWQTVVVSVDIADLSVYFPNNTLCSTLPQPMETDLQNALKSSPPLNVAIFKVPMVTLRCASLKQSLVETRLPVILPTAIWSPDRCNFPWSLNILELQCFTSHGTSQLQLLKPLSATCTVGISTKYSNNALMSLALCVHLDTTAISLSISEEQVALLASLAVVQAEVFQTLIPNWSAEPKHKEDAIFSSDPVVGSEDSLSNSLPEEDQIGAGPHSGPVKLTGFLQWTLARLTVSVYNHQAKTSPEKLKLTLDVEDIFISLDIEKVYHKLKLKVATASVQHYLRPSSNSSWDVGPFEGLVMRGHDPDGLGISPGATNEESTPNSSGFLTATLTRAYCSNLHSKLATSAKTSKVLKQKAVLEDRFITEIEVKLQPLDFVLSPTTLGTILNVLNPILQLPKNKSATRSVLPATRPPALTYFSSSSLPLLYLDLMAVRIVLCVSEKTHCHHDVVLIQFDSISTNPQPENPLCRVPLRPDIYQAAEKHRILGVPGSEVEDRQYQLDVVGLSVSTGSWKEIRSMLVKDAVPILQNPALDWNEGRRPSSTPPALENLCPSIPAFNLCLVLAPAIIYQGNTIVCGHSTEVNAVSEIVVALSVEQVELFGVLVRELIQILPKKENVSISTEPTVWLPDRHFPIKESLPFVSVHRDSMDSGVKTAHSGSNQPAVKDMISFKGSMDLNTVSFTKGLSSISPSQSIQPTTSALSLSKRSTGVKENVVPLEILVTGSGFSCSIYSLVNVAKTNEILPLLHVRISQPHAFISRHGETLTVQASVFDMCIKSGMAECRNPISRDKLNSKVFPQILIETRNGEPNLLTGIPPALISVKWNRISSKPAKLDIEIGRPVRFIISLDSVNYVKDVIQKLASKWRSTNPAPQDEMPEVDVNDDIDSGIKEESLCGYKANYRKKYCSYINVISVSTQKLIAVFLTKNKDAGNVLLSVDGVILTTQLSQHSFSNSFIFRAVTVATQNEGKTKLLINPWSLSVNVSLFWESWLQSPTLQISANSDFFTLNVAPDTLQCLRQVYLEYYGYFSKEFLEKSNPSQQTPSSYDIDQELEQEQHYKEDLQAGAFQFVDGGDDREELPLTYQVVFWTGCHQNPTMAWRYPQPRALTRVLIQPLPFRDSQPGDKVDCSLQYWSECHRTFKDYISFSLCESLACTVALPNPDPQPVVASTWRVVLGSAAQCHQLPINVKALAACLRVDSYFCLSLIPRLQAAINLSSAKVSVWTEVNPMRPMPAQFSRYTCDGIIPSSHNVLVFSLSQTNISYSKWKQGHLLLTCDGKPRIDILNYRTLCMLCCVEPFRFTSRLSLCSGSSQSVNVVTEAVTCRIGPAICHTLSTTCLLWSQYSTSIPQHLVIMTPFVICNNSHLPIRFGQVETKESITLQCMQCHLYSWFSTKSHLAFRFSLALTSGCEIWSKSVSVSKDGSQLVSVCDDESRDWNLVITTKPMSSFVTEVMISGQLVVQNTMDCSIELIVSCERQNSMVVPAKSTPPGVILSPHYAPFLRIRFPGISFTWSGQIPLKSDGETSLKQWLVKVPLQNKEEFNSIWCHIVWDAPNTSGRIFVMICSMYRISSLLPCGAYVHVETPELDSLKKAAVIGSGKVQDLVCPGTPEHSHFLTFQLEGKTLPSSSKVPLSYAVIEPRLSAQSPKTVDINKLIKKALLDEEPTNYPISECTSAQWTSAGQQETVVLVKVDYSSDFIEPRSLQVDVSPWGLLINSLGCHVCLQVNNQTICSLPHLSVIAPPTIDSTFHLGLYIGTAMYLSNPLQLARDHSFYMPHIAGIIPLEGCINTTVDCDSVVSYVNIASIDMKGIRLLHVRASYVVANFSSRILKIASLVIRRNQEDKGKHHKLPRNLDLHTISLPPQNPGAKQNKGHPMTEWLCVGIGEPEASFISVSLGGEFSCPVPVPQSRERESNSILVPSITPDSHINSTLLLCSEIRDGQNFITLWDQDWPQIIVHNHTTLSLAFAKAKTDKGGAAEEYNPDWPWQLRLPPGCSADYHLPSDAEQLIQNNSKPSPMVVIAVINTSSDLTWSEAISLSPCRGRLIRLSGTSGFNVAVNNRGFTTHIILSHMNHTEISPLDVRLRLMQESQLDSNVDSMTSIEDQLEATAKSSHHITALKNFEDSSSLHESHNSIESRNVKCVSCPDKSCLPGLEDVTCFLQNVTVIFGMESSSGCDCREVAAFVMDDIGLTIHPTKHPESEAKELLIRITFGDIQLDNQKFPSGGYDFPVVLMIQPQESSEPNHVEFSINGSALTLVEMSRTKGSSMDLVMTVDVNSYRTPALQDASLTMKPLQIYVEDTYLIEMKNILAKIVPSYSFYDVQSSVNKFHNRKETFSTEQRNLVGSSVATDETTAPLAETGAGHSSTNTKQNGADDEYRDEELFNVSEPDQDVPSFGLLPETMIDTENANIELVSKRPLELNIHWQQSNTYVDKEETEDQAEYLCNLIIPKEVIAAAQELAFPLRLRSFTISPLSVLVSLHTSTAFYIAIDHSPLNFSSFKRGALVTTAYRLGHALTVHYFLGAFYGSAWALVSLELLGAPGGLARTVGSGVRDFVSLPYHGIQQGPRAFLLGIAHGSASLMKHVTAGTITSVTKLAASWARTLDRLTLDKNDLVLSEEARRHRPEGLTQGLMHGLSEFGIRLLGAAGSIVHQPLQYAISPNPDHSLANSIGLGVVGFFARPLSGAAELVARTGEGILSGAGWSSLPKARNQSRTPHSHCSVEALLKFSWKLLAPSEQIFFSLEASSAENYESIVLLITKNHLHIIRMENGPIPFKTIPLSELRISSHHSDPTLIILRVVSPEVEAEELSRTRVAQFVRDCSRVVSEDTNVQAQNIPDPSHSFVSEPSFCYFVHPEIREYFITFINFVRRNSTSRDFAVIS